MPTWVKYGIAFIVGFIVAKNPIIIHDLLHMLNQVTNGG